MVGTRGKFPNKEAITNLPFARMISWRIHIWRLLATGPKDSHHVASSNLVFSGQPTKHLERTWPSEEIGSKAPDQIQFFCGWFIIRLLKEFMALEILWGIALKTLTVDMADMVRPMMVADTPV